MRHSPPESSGHLVLPLAASDPPPVALRERVGNKAWNLMQLAAHGMPVPEGFVLDVALCRAVLSEELDARALRDLLAPAVAELESATECVLGDPKRPLVLSVRSGAAASMPGMMDTVLDIGIFDRTVAGLIERTGNPRLAWDSYRRLIESYATSVTRADPAPFVNCTTLALRASGADAVDTLDSLQLRSLVRALLDTYHDVTGEAFPQDSWRQLVEAVIAVYRSWDTPRATTYRKLHALEHLRGTAVTVQRMVFGNSGPRSGSGVGFTRNPVTGEPGLYADFSWNAQGEDVVSGHHPVFPLADLAQAEPLAYAQLIDHAARLERIFADAQDIEFTIEDGRLYLLQTRSAKRSNWAALRIAVDLVDEGLISPAAALERLVDVNPATLVRTRVAEGSKPLAHGTGASLGSAAGEIALTAEAAQALGRAGRSVILVRPDVDTDDIAGLAAAAGILTRNGGRTSHAAVVARQMQKVCIVGCAGLEFETDATGCRIGGIALPAGEPITLDGESGAVYRGAVTLIEERPTALLERLRAWRDGRSQPAA